MSKTCVIFHDYDLDGWMSAAIVKHWFTINNNYVISVNKDTLSENDKYLDNENEAIHKDNIIEFIGYNYGQPIPDLSEYDKVIMCDISFPIEEMEKLRQNLQDNFIWIDHHISAIKSIEERTNTFYEGLRRTDFAACELTWLYFMTDSNKTHFDDDDIKNIPEIVRLLGRYDCFGHKGTHEETYVLEFQYGARQCITNYEEAYKYLQLSLQGIINYDFVSENTIEDRIHDSGKIIYQYLCTEAKQTYKNGFDIKFMIPHPEYIGEGQYKLLRFICINKERFNPINFGIDYHKDGYDGCACFHYANGMWNFSLYNDNGKVDCSIIAKQHGGGGHKGAAGFRIEDINQIIK